jgi:hypothetical protein
MNVAEGREAAQPSYARRIDETATISLRWSLLLARLWLDNINLEVMSLDTVSVNKPSPGWLATLSQVEKHGNETSQDTFVYVQMQSRNQERQLSGLLQFARELSWPNVNGLVAKIMNKDIVGISGQLYGYLHS